MPRAVSLALGPTNFLLGGAYCRRVRPTVAQMRALRRRDPALARAVRGLAPFPGFPGAEGRRGTHWEALARAIVFQQLAGAAAGTIHRRVCALTGGARFPRPEQILALPDERLRAAGLSAAKLASLRDLAARLTDGRLTLRAIGRHGDDVITQRLVAVRGIGVWSAQMFLLFRLGRLDVMPTGDLGVREGMRLLDGLDARPSPSAAGVRGACWSPLCSVGAWYMWRLVEARRAAV